MSLPKLQEGQQIEDYVLQKTLGCGSFGMVFKATCQKYGVVAFKAILRSRFQEHKGFLGQLVYNEKTALSLLSSEHVIKLYEYFETKDYAIFILEYCDGGTLEEYWQNNNKVIPQFQALIFFKQLLKGMKALHKQKIIHRDLKMANILIHGGILKIADLGFCHLLNDFKGQVNENLGSNGTMAPETIEGHAYGLQADMFAVGVILYQMIFSTFPFNSINRKTFLNDVRRNNPPKFKLKHGGLVDNNICELLTNMLKYDQNKRLKWSDLFSNQIFMGQSSMSVIKDHTTYLADIDPQKSRVFYQKAEAAGKQFEIQNPINDEQMQNEITKTTNICQELSRRHINQSKDITQVQPNRVKQNVNNSVSHIIHQEAQQIELEEIKIIDQYIKEKQPISFLSITYNEMKEFQHKQVFDCIFVSYILIKQIYYSHYKLRDQIKKNKQYNQLIKKETFKSFMREFEEENEFLSLHLTMEYQVVQANFKKLQKYIDNNWNCEVYQLAQTEQFQNIYCQVLSNYLNNIGQEELKANGQIVPKRLQYIVMIAYIKDFEKLKKVQDIEKTLAEIQRKSANELINYIKSQIR